jgi:hypothetical protein
VLTQFRVLAAIASVALAMTVGGTGAHSSTLKVELTHARQAASVSSARCQVRETHIEVSGRVTAAVAVPSPSGVLAMIYQARSASARFGVAKINALAKGESRSFRLTVKTNGPSTKCFVEWGKHLRPVSFIDPPPP